MRAAEAIGYIIGQLVGGVIGALLLAAVLGMTLTLNIMMVGPLTGAPFNPARALGPMIATGDLSNAWLYVAAPIVGALTTAIGHMGIAGLAAQPATAQARVPAWSPAE